MIFCHTVMFELGNAKSSILACVDTSSVRKMSSQSHCKLLRNLLLRHW